MHPPTVSAAWPREGGEVAVAGGGHAVTGPLVSTRVLATRAHTYTEHSDLVIFNISFSLISKSILIIYESVQVELGTDLLLPSVGQ